MIARGFFNKSNFYERLFALIGTIYYIICAKNACKMNLQAYILFFNNTRSRYRDCARADMARNA